jgi:hypothetical protein
MWHLLDDSKGRDLDVSIGFLLTDSQFALGGQQQSVVEGLSHIVAPVSGLDEVLESDEFDFFFFFKLFFTPGTFLGQLLLDEPTRAKLVTRGFQRWVTEYALKELKGTFLPIRILSINICPWSNH